MSDVAVVTGASRGIGLACAKAFFRRGFRVAMLARESARLRAAARSIGEGARAIACDVSDASSVERAAREVHDELGTPCVVVANAGIVRRGDVHTLAVADFDAVVAVNLRGVFLTARAFVGSMRNAKKGRFVAIGSISATLGTASASAYNASKWGVVGFVKSLAEELRGTGVQAVVVNPGSTDTDMLRGSPYAPQMTAEDVAKVVVFAALDAPDAIHGSAIDVFGG